MKDKFLSFTYTFCMCYILMLPLVCLNGCWLLDFIAGKSPETVTKEVDTNKDGEISKEEIKASPYDIDKDGTLSESEMKAAMAPHVATDYILQLMAVFNIPFAGAAAAGIRSARKNKSHLETAVQGIDELVALKKDGITKGDIYGAIAIVSERKKSFKAFGDIVGVIKKSIRAEHADKKIEEKVK